MPFKSRRTKGRSKSKRVNKNTHAIAKLARQLHTKRDYSKDNSHIIEAETYVTRLVTPSTWRNVFQTFGDVNRTAVGTSYTIRRMALRYMCQPENTVAATTDGMYQLFVVSLKPAHARQFRAQGYTNLVNEYHYEKVALDSAGGLLSGFGLFMLNKDIFNIHYHSGVRRFTNTTLIGTPITNARDSTSFGYASMPWKKTLVCKDATPGGFDNYPVGDVPDNAQLYVIVLSNASVEAPLFTSMNTIVNGTSHRGL